MKASVTNHDIKIYFTRTVFLLLFTTPLISSAQWVHFGQQKFGKVAFDLYAKRGSWGMGQQFYGANFINGIFYDIRVKGELYAQLTCGNEVFSRFEFTVKMYDSKRVLDPNDTDNLARGWLVESTGLLGSADEEECKGKQITLNGHINYNRIHALGVRKLNMWAIQSDGREVPVDVNGNLIETEETKQRREEQQRQQVNNYNQNSGSASHQNNNNSNYQNNNYQQEQQRQEQERTAQEEEQRRKQQEFEDKRKILNDRLNEANQRTAAAWDNFNEGLSNIFDMVMQNMFRNSLQRENQQRQDKFENLQELVSTKNGTLKNCTHCYGQGYNTCGSCNGSGKKTCMSCFGKGKSNCNLCYGTGKYFGNTCSGCGGAGSKECMLCKSSGSTYCTDCHATGKEFCTYCSGTGQKFDQEF